MCRLFELAGDFMIQNAFQLFCFALFCFATTTSLLGQALEVKLILPLENEIAFIDIEETIEIVIANRSQEPVSFPKFDDSQSGYENFWFEFTDTVSGKKYSVKRSAKIDETQPDVSTMTIGPGEERSFFSSFIEHRWDNASWKNIPAPNSGKVLEVTAHFSHKGTTTVSQPLKTTVNFQRAALPHDYLWNGFPAVAMKLFRENPELAHKRDDQGRTPLHVAARFGHVDVVRWLLDNKAEIDAIAYNRFTPLSLTSEPKIIRMLIENGANPYHSDVRGTPFHHAITNFLTTSSAADQATRDLRKMAVDAFLDSGVAPDLIAAIQLNKLDTVKKRLAEKPELMAEYREHQEPLRAAAKYGRLEIAQYLLENFPKHTDVDNFEGGTGYPVTKDALAHVEVLKLFLAHDPDLERPVYWTGPRTGRWFIGDDASLLHFAIRDGSPESVKLLLDAGLSPFRCAKDRDGDDITQTPIHVAIFFGKLESANVVLEHASFQTGEPRQKVLNDCLLRSVIGNSPSPKLVRSLIEAGAELKPIDDEVNLIKHCVKGIHPGSDKNPAIREMVMLLHENGVPIDLFSAVSIEDTPQVLKMLAANPELAESSGPSGLPALHMATRLGNVELVKAMLDAGCDVNLKNQSQESSGFGEHALHAAVFWGEPEVARLLIASGAEVNAQAQKQATALHRAAYVGEVELVKLLLENGADPSLKNRAGQRPFDLARNPAIQRLLRPTENPAPASEENN